MVNSSSSSTWNQAYTKLRFFSKIRRTEELIVEHESKIINHDDEGAILQMSVKMLHFGSMEEKAEAAGEIKRLAKDDLSRRKMMADLGVIPPLVAMTGSEYTIPHRRVAVQALLELANGTFTNKAFMVEAGILTKLSESINIKDQLAKNEFAHLIMVLSSLVFTQIHIDPSKVIPLVLHMLQSDSNIDTKKLCLDTLHNLSTVIENVGSLANDEVVQVLLKLSSVKETSEKALATLGNLVLTLKGKKALESSPMVPECLIEILTCDDKSKSQELSVYILMILAHQSSFQRMKMVEGGIVRVLLEVALLGSPLAQKRALKLLQWFKEERHMKMGPHSGPQSRMLSFGSPSNQDEADEGIKLMKNMVQQSLYKNMETITRRANSNSDSNSRFKVLVSGSSSKSLPY
ncbi:hypothetical protein R6Q57_014630 [Mikania cordata]